LIFPRDRFNRVFGHPAVNNLLTNRSIHKISSWIPSMSARMSVRGVPGNGVIT
jgi:hypothetical protein